jgi:uncharacterized protein (TIGR03032 family)
VSSATRVRKVSSFWAQHDGAWRDPARVVAGCEQVSPVSPELLRCEVWGDWWSVIENLHACIVVSREYEHLMVALSVTSEGPRKSFMALPHPSGLAFNPSSARLHVASTRNPNQIYSLMPARLGDGLDDEHRLLQDVLVPVAASFLPGRLYLHDLALIGQDLYGAAAGINAVVRFTDVGRYEVAWWPRSIEREGHPDLTRNYLQLNSIAAGEDLSSSFFTASTAVPSKRRPGHRNFPVDGRGVIFSGATREPVLTGLTRPHSARLYRGQTWVDDSGYGRVGVVRDGHMEVIAELPGWTRGLNFCQNVAFVGTSRVIPRFAHYAPGLNVEHSVCGVHALDSENGEVLGSVVWPAGNQIFDIAVLPLATTSGFPAVVGHRQGGRSLKSFYFSYTIPKHTGTK